MAEAKRMGFDVPKEPIKIELNNVLLSEVKRDFSREQLPFLYQFSFYSEEYSKMELFFENFAKLKLDIIKIAKASQILFDTNNPIAAEKLILFNQLYLNGELDTSYMNDRSFLKALSLKSNI